jgi:hypothetical protein
VILFGHLLLCLSYRNLPTLNIVLLMASAVNVRSVAPDSEIIFYVLLAVHSCIIL